MHLSQSLLTALALSATQVTASLIGSRAAAPEPKVCTVEPADDEGDSASAIAQAFEECGQGGTVAFKNETYHVGSVLNTTGLKDCTVELKGTLLWSTDFDYWIDNSLPVGYQNQSSAWLFGGDNVHFNGFGYGELNGNGQAWYDWGGGAPNIAGRPHAITVTGTTNSLFEGIRFIQSQMWTMTVIWSDSVVLQDIYVDNACDDDDCGDSSNINTDGFDSVYANNITLERWWVRSGDDSISFKANSTNIYVNNCTFVDGLGFALGSIGQYEDEYETLENIYVSNVIIHGSEYAAYIKSWTGIRDGDPPNGGGGGTGRAKNLTFTDFQVDGISDNIFYITQCIYRSGDDCDSSTFHISDVLVQNIEGSQESGDVASMQCSAAVGCQNIEFENINVTDDDGNDAESYLCDNVEDTTGFECTGST